MAIKGGPIASKKVDAASVAKELNLQDFDINLCAEAKDVHCKKIVLIIYSAIIQMF